MSDPLRAAVEALADKWEGDRLNTGIDKEGAAYLLRALLAEHEPASSAPTNPAPEFEVQPDAPSWLTDDDRERILFHRGHADYLAAVERIVARHRAEAHREGYKTARADLISGAFVGGPTYEALRDSFSGRQIRAEAIAHHVRSHGCSERARIEELIEASSLDGLVERAAQALTPMSPRGPEQSEWRLRAARAVLDAVADEIRAEAWEEAAAVAHEAANANPVNGNTQAGRDWLYGARTVAKAVRERADQIGGDHGDV